LAPGHIDRVHAQRAASGSNFPSHQQPFLFHHDVRVLRHVLPHLVAHRDGKADRGVPGIDVGIGFENRQDAGFLVMLPCDHRQEAEE
jgi:hypothetical protein